VTSEQLLEVFARNIDAYSRKAQVRCQSKLCSVKDSATIAGIRHAELRQLKLISSRATRDDGVDVNDGHIILGVLDRGVHWSLSGACRQESRSHLHKRPHD
jgi:hypothetical protein